MNTIYPSTRRPPTPDAPLLDDSARIWRAYLHAAAEVGAEVFHDEILFADEAQQQRFAVRVTDLLKDGGAS